MILLRAGGELRSLEHELEKLILYVGDQPRIRSQDVDAIFADQGDGWVFDLTRCIAERNAVTALTHLARLLAQGEHPLKLLGTIATEVRRLLAARQLMDGEVRGQWKRGLTYQQFQQNVLREGAPILTRNPYADYMKVAEKNDIQPPWIEACLFHRQQRRRSTVHQEEPVGGFNEIATLVAAAVAEGIATAENMKLHELILRAI